MTIPELDVRWRRFSMTAKGKDAIDAVRRPLFVMLLVNAVAMLMIVIAAVVRPQWPTVTGLVVEWMR